MAIARLTKTFFSYSNGYFCASLSQSSLIVKICFFMENPHHFEGKDILLELFGNVETTVMSFFVLLCFTQAGECLQMSELRLW